MKELENKLTEREELGTITYQQKVFGDFLKILYNFFFFFNKLGNLKAGEGS